MKAKEYAEQYSANPTYDELTNIVLAMIQETGQIARQRGVKTDSAMAAVIREVDNKYRAFVRLVGDPAIREDGFKDSIFHVVPEVKEIWKPRQR